MPRSYVPKIIKIGLLVSEYPKRSLYINKQKPILTILIPRIYKLLSWKLIEPFWLKKNYV